MQTQAGQETRASAVHVDSGWDGRATSTGSSMAFLALLMGKALSLLKHRLLL